eukprot:1699406-Rhodomonas_salina.2
MQMRVSVYLEDAEVAHHSLQLLIVREQDPSAEARERKVLGECPQDMDIVSHVFGVGWVLLVAQCCDRSEAFSGEHARGIDFVAHEVDLLCRTPLHAHLECFLGIDLPHRIAWMADQQHFYLRSFCNRLIVRALENCFGQFVLWMLCVSSFDLETRPLVDIILECTVPGHRLRQYPVNARDGGGGGHQGEGMMHVSPGSARHHAIASKKEPHPDCRHYVSAIFQTRAER